MSRLEDLIQTLCPDGVEKLKLSTISTIKRGQRITKSELMPDGPYPVISGGVNPMGFTNDFNRNENTITVAQYGTAGFVNWQANKFWANDVCYSIYPDEKLLNRYLYYSLLSAQNLIYTLVIDAVPAHLPHSRLAALEIFVPPLPVQEEIVRILDTFSGVVTELEAEQAARVRQYEHYRNELLSFDSKSKIMEKLLADYCPEGVEYKALGDIGTFFGGLTGKTKQDFQNGNKKFISYMNVYKNPAVDITAEDFVRIGNEERQNTVEYGDILFTGSSETPEECGISSVMIKQPDEPFYLNSFTIGFRLHNPSLLDPEFSKHLFRSAELRSQINKTANGVTRFNVSKSKLSGVVIPLPPLPMQKEIVSILNRFDTLVNDLKSGLPAEIALRRKQYEYYRDKLLTFPQKPGG